MRYFMVFSLVLALAFCEGGPEQGIDKKWGEGMYAEFLRGALSP